MMLALQRISAIFALTTVVVTTAEAQIYSTDFSTLDGWTVTTDCASGFEWAADATPEVAYSYLDYVPYTNFSPYVSPPASLNFNDGVDIGGGFQGFSNGQITCGSVTSPAIDLGVAPRVPVLRFMAGGWTEGCCGWDVLTLRVRAVGGGTVHLVDHTVPLIGIWILNEFELDSSWGLVEIEFSFHTVDGWSNGGPGPFIDDLEIIDRCGIDQASPCDDYLSFCFGDGTGTACPCGNRSAIGEGRGCRNSSGQGARLIPSGTPEVANDSVRFQLDGAPAISFAFLVSADNALPQANPGVGNQDRDGLRCVGGNLLRHGARATDLAGRAGFGTPGWGPPDNPAPGLLGQYGFVSGQTRYFQTFVRDDTGAVCQSGLNRSNGVKVTIR